MAGLNAYNEAGIFLSSHTVPSNETSARGVPVFTTACQVIRRAKTFDTAVELFRAFRPPTGWSYTLASTKERRVGTVELVEPALVRARVDGRLPCANQPLS